MPSGKQRLYIALYPGGVANNEERKYEAMQNTSSIPNAKKPPQISLGLLGRTQD